MAELTADLFVSLDGFAAGVGTGPFFGYDGPELESWVREACGAISRRGSVRSTSSPVIRSARSAASRWFAACWDSGWSTGCGS